MTLVVHDLGEKYPCSKVLLAVLDDQPVGVLGLKGGEWGGAHDQIDIVWVDAESRRAGIARALVEHAAALAGGPVFHDGVLSTAGIKLVRAMGIERAPHSGSHGGRVLSPVDANRAGAELFLWACSLGSRRWAAP